MTNSLLVLPVQLDVLRLEHEIHVAGPLLDFIRLPWANSPTHKDSPYLSETLTAEAFEDQHQLQPGLHFHWSLPLALTKTSSIGIVYRQSFQSVFGKGEQANGEKSGDDLWDELVRLNWLQVIDEHTGMARTNLPAEEEQLARLQANLSKYTHAIRKLLQTSVFPPVPNRWLLSRIIDGQPQILKMIESDYLWPKGQDRLGDAPMSDHYTIYPQITDNPADQPYRYMGRAYDAETGPPAQDSVEYLNSPLTAAGYGEPAFAAFYPICRSVFGHYDPQPPPVEHEQYELIGLYDNPELNYFQIFVNAFKATWQKDHLDTDGTVGTHQQHQQVNYLYLDLLDAIHRQLRIEIPIEAPQQDLEKIGADASVEGAPPNAWEYLRMYQWIDEEGRLLPKAYTMTTVVDEPFQSRSNDIRRIINHAIESHMPDHVICYARCACPSKGSARPEVVQDSIKIALGNSPTEALSALLASAISTDKKSMIEDQLEAIQFASTLQQTTLDTGPMFEALRHEKQFHAVPGGQGWCIRAKKQTGQEATDAAEDAQMTLPWELANKLNWLNHLEEEKAQNGAAIGSLRRQIYADWCWYLTLESGLKGMKNAPDFSRLQEVPPFGTHVGEGKPPRCRQPQFGTHTMQSDEEASAPAIPARERENPYVAERAEFLGGLKAFITNEIESQLAALLSQETRLNDTINKQFAAIQADLLVDKSPALELAPQPASRFWRPNDPVLFISGFDASHRHQDTRTSLAARLVTIDRDLQSVRDFKAFFEERWQGELTSLPPPDWRPLFLAWDVAFSQAHQPQDEAYDSNHLQSYYRLGNTDFEAVQLPVTYDTPIPFYGRTILTPGASISLKKTIISRLVPVVYQQFERESQPPPATIGAFNTWLKAIAPQVETPPVDDPDVPDEQQIKQWLTDELDLQNDTDSQLVQHLLAYLKKDSPQLIIQQFLNEHSDADLAGNLDLFLDWATTRTHIKASYVAQYQPDLNHPLDITLVDQEQVCADFVAKLQTYLGDSLQRYHDTMHIPADQQASYLNDHYNELINWYQPQVGEALHLVVEIRAYQALLGIRGLAQAMIGFSDALIMRHLAFQLPVYNPFPLDGREDFTASVRTAVQTDTKVAPGEHLPFSPWRAGKLALSELELLDNFGRYWPTDPSNRGAGLADFLMHGTDTMPDVGESPGQEFAVAPRLAQAARLAFRWLAARTDIEEMNDHPASNPICGWVVPNHLDDSLMIYAPEGDALGSIDEEGHWRTFPGNSRPIIPADIANPYLARMVQWLCKQGKDFLSDFLSTLDIAQENMEPESFAQHEALALLIGHPLALVRADVCLQLVEPPAVNVSQIQLQRDVSAYDDYKSKGAQGSPPPRNTFGFEHVHIPLRLGEFRRLNDGLAGYWLEDANGRYADDSFYALQTDPTPGLSARIKTRHQANSDDRDEGQFLISLSLSDTTPCTISMLLDPRAPIHATTGILPVKALSIPSDQYQAALQRMQVAFLTAPVLAPEMGMELSLPTEPGFDWSWVQLEGQHWTSMSAQGIIHKHQLTDFLGAGANVLWGALVQHGWLEALSDDTARIVPQDERPQKELSPAFAPVQEAVELLFHRLRIRPFDPMATFDPGLHIREGWLRLRPSQP